MAGKANGSKSATSAATADNKAVQDQVQEALQEAKPDDAATSSAEVSVAAGDQVAIEATHIRVRAVPLTGFRRAGYSFNHVWTEISLDDLDEVQVDQLLTERNLVCEFLVKDEAQA